MPSYTAYFETDADYAERGIEADTPAQALQMARALDADELYFIPHNADAPLNEIRIVRDADLATVAEWKSDEQRLREVAPELLEALEQARAALNTAPRFAVPSLDTDSYTIAALCDQAIAKATPEGAAEPGSAPELDEHTMQTARVVEAPEHLRYLVTALEVAAPIVEANYPKATPEGAADLPSADPPPGQADTPERRLAQQYERAELALIEEPAHGQPATAERAPDVDTIDLDAIRSQLAAHGYVAQIRGIDDLRAVRPDLTPEQCMEVLTDGYTSTMQRAIYDRAQMLFPTPEGAPAGHALDDLPDPPEYLAADAARRRFEIEDAAWLAAQGKTFQRVYAEIEEAAEKTITPERDGPDLEP